jgi:hypothetical protein
MLVCSIHPSFPAPTPALQGSTYVQFSIAFIRIMVFVPRLPSVSTLWFLSPYLGQRRGGGGRSIFRVAGALCLFQLGSGRSDHRAGWKQAQLEWMSVLRGPFWPLCSLSVLALLLSSVAHRLSFVFWHMHCLQHYLLPSISFPRMVRLRSGLRRLRHGPLRDGHQAEPAFPLPFFFSLDHSALSYAVVICT